ncbi:Hypothetical predicted protein [Olea europaea subsp. europaea]|uniref:Uncharacterized protein n=1 Tax=Olea europaea subsp. europaea TaxID=158383 RepID=A0A8S0TQ78_OLEEU|nr:Hypothetical predicted protein [Olea europaea subsp. europaea]
MFQYNCPEKYFIDAYNFRNKLNSPITLMSCPYPINSSFFLETAHCGNRVFDSNASTRRYTYVNVGNLDASDVRDMCSIDLIVMTSWPFKDVNNLSLSDIHGSLLYGFELSWSWPTATGFTINDVIYGFPRRLLPLIMGKLYPFYTELSFDITI